MPLCPRLLRVARALLLCTLAALPGCALAHNYADAAGPIYLHTEPASPVARPDLHVLTYNIKFGQQLDRAVDLLTWRDGIERPDVLVLQELDAPGVERLARALGMNSVYVPAAIHPASPRDFGVAILSPWPLRDARKILLPHLHRFRKMTRAAATATIDTPLGAVRVYAVHIETPFGLPADKRREQVAAIHADAATWTGPVVIAGDFNGKALARAAAGPAFAWLTRDVGGTAGPFSVDHIIVRGLCPAGDPSSGRVVYARGISDHLPVWARARLCTP